MYNEIYLRRRNKALISIGLFPCEASGSNHAVPNQMGTLGKRLSDHLASKSGNSVAVVEKVDQSPAHTAHAATVAKNFESLGYVLSPQLVDGLQSLSVDALTKWYEQTFGCLKKLKGAHRNMSPMYPNFPKQVMEMSQADLYLNALLHYWTKGRYIPATEIKDRLPLLDVVAPQVLELGTIEDFESLFAQIAGSNTSLSEQDKQDLAWFVETYKDQIGDRIPDSVPQKENMAFLADLLLTHTVGAEAFIGRFCRTATDALRLAVAFSGGDVSLASNTRFEKLSRKKRKLILALVDQSACPTDDMLRHKEAWKKLGERLHVGEFKAQFPRAFESFEVLRKDLPYKTFNGKVEAALVNTDSTMALALLSERPGDLTRRLDHLLRLSVQRGDNFADEVLKAFKKVSDKVSTPVLLQTMHHFSVRNHGNPIRVFFPKGSVAKAQMVPNTLGNIPDTVCGAISTVCEETLISRFSALEPLGNVYVDPDLLDCPVPSGGRSASKALRTMARGTKLPLRGGDTVRFFVWWKDSGIERGYRSGTTDIDLSAVLYDDDFNEIGPISFYNLKEGWGYHSGDITSAPNGASEFIDIDMSKVANGRYVAMMLNSYSGERFSELPECFAGWMVRSHPESGEIYDPRTVEDKLDVTSVFKQAMPLIIDTKERKMIWCDMSVKDVSRRFNTVRANRAGITATLVAFVGLDKPNLYELFSIHAKARGTLVDSFDEADVVYSLAEGLPFRGEEIASQYML